MEERIKLLRKELGLNQTDFGNRIGVKQSTITGYETGIRAPLDSVIISICREFDVNEEWLRYGKGEMFIELDRDEEIVAWSSKITRSDYDKQFVPEFVHMLSKLDERDWETLEKIAKMLAKKKD